MFDVELTITNFGTNFYATLDSKWMIWSLLMIYSIPCNTLLAIICYAKELGKDLLNAYLVLSVVLLYIASAYDEWVNYREGNSYIVY